MQTESYQSGLVLFNELEWAHEHKRTLQAGLALEQWLKYSLRRVWLHGYTVSTVFIGRFSDAVCREDINRPAGICLAWTKQ